MSTEDRAARRSGAGSGRSGGDPLRMSETEKRMAEWEARHDVAARGHRPAPDVLQHYLAHERLAHERAAEQRPSADRTDADADADAEGADHQSLPAAVRATGKGIRGRLRRLFRRDRPAR